MCINGGDEEVCLSQAVISTRWMALCGECRAIFTKNEIDVGWTRAEIKDVLRFGMRDVYWDWDEACMKGLG